MKLNFWQWLGIVLVVVGAIGYLMTRDDGSPSAPAPQQQQVEQQPEQPADTTTPAATPATTAPAAP